MNPPAASSRKHLHQPRRLNRFLPQKRCQQHLRQRQTSRHRARGIPPWVLDARGTIEGHTYNRPQHHPPRFLALFPRGDLLLLVVILLPAVLRSDPTLLQVANRTVVHLLQVTAKFADDPLPRQQCIQGPIGEEACPTPRESKLSRLENNPGLSKTRTQESPLSCK